MLVDVLRVSGAFPRGCGGRKEAKTGGETGGTKSYRESSGFPPLQVRLLFILLHTGWRLENLTKAFPFISLQEGEILRKSGRPSAREGRKEGSFVSAK